MKRFLRAVGVAALLACATTAHAAVITIVNNDGAGEGFNDPTAAAPVGGNNGATLGQQRLNVFQHAADIWGAALPSNIEIKVNAQFNPLSCNATSGVLGSAGPVTASRDFAGAPVSGHWYHIALANKLNNTDLNGASYEINATFNSAVGGATCLTAGWYLGFDGNEGSQIELLPVVLHELGHGLGFSTLTSGSSGAWNTSFPSIFDKFLYDPVTGLHWDSASMSNAQRVASAVGCTKLEWDGAQVVAHRGDFLGDKPLVRVTAPAGIAGEYEVGTATFGAALTGAGVSGPVVLVSDNFGNPTNGCESITNNLTGKIAFIDRGTCSFPIKVKNAQNAGAIGVIVADSIAGCPPAGMGGADPTITIPSVRITLADGNLLRAQLGNGLTATLLSDPTKRAGTDGAGRVFMYSPSTFTSGSSVSHFDTSLEPSVLMEPAITTGLSSNIDLTRSAFADIGWFTGALDVPVTPRPAALEPSAPNPMVSTALIAWTLARDEAVDLRVYDIIGREVARLATGPMTQGRHSLTWDGTDSGGRRVPPGVYHYRLRTPTLNEKRTLTIVR
ncbi:MAG: PA domain-containing protein [Candidatus Eisenbacteria bacterium]